MIKTSRLRKVAAVENLGEKNMTSSVLNLVLQDNKADAAVSSTIFRRMMSSTTKYIVEIWQLNNSQFAVFSGYFTGDWTTENVVFNGVFEDQPAAELYVQENLQEQAESKENLMAPSSAQEVQEEQKGEKTSATQKKSRRNN